MNKQLTDEKTLSINTRKYSQFYLELKMCDLGSTSLRQGDC